MSQLADQDRSTVMEPPLVPSPSLARLLVRGSSALGAATLLERGCGFLANLAAARLGGPQVFGAYSLAMTTATNVASYAGAGIGTTANRFSGEYPYGSSGYGRLLRTLAMVSLGSASLAVIILWFAATPLATYLLRNPALAQLLRLAAFSAGAIILLECMRGLLVGQRRFRALMTLSALFGVGLAIVLPLTAHYGPSQMVIGQAITAIAAIVICVISAKALQFAAPKSQTTVGGPKATDIIRFGAVQLTGMIGLNAAGWWLASLIARADISLVQAGWFSIAMQLRNICAMPPGLISQTVYAQLTDDGGREYGGPNRITALSTIVTTALSLAICGPAAALMPWLITHLYGKAFAGAALTATLAVATALIHMSAAPAAARLTVVSLSSTGIINACWSILLVILGTWLIPRGGAAEAAASFLVAHLFSAITVLVVLMRIASASSELVFSSMPGVVGAISIAGLGWLRTVSHQTTTISWVMVAVTGILLFTVYYSARKVSGLFEQVGFTTLIPRLLMGRLSR